MSKASVLIVEDSAPVAALYEEYLGGEPCQVQVAGSLSEARRILAKQAIDALVLDIGLPDGSGMDFLKEVRASGQPTEIVMVTASGSMKTAIEAMREGAFDFLVKPFDRDRLVVTLRNALERRRMADTITVYRENFERDRYFGFVGASLAMQAVYRTIDSAAQSKATVFVTGESGTGKELTAEAIHRRSHRNGKPFVALNCAAIPRDLLESELFGHVRGAFTGATSDRIGSAQQADGGTLFLDEICEMDPSLQSKLLRFLQMGAVQRVGSPKIDTVDVRIVCATNRDPVAEVAAGRFREDLFYRLHVIPLNLPPLREREGDVLLIARDLLGKISKEENKEFRKFDPDAEALLTAHSWPGNVRELQNVVRNAVVLNQGDTIGGAMLPAVLRARVAENRPVVEAPEVRVETVPMPGSAASPLRPMWQIERDAIDAAIAACGGNIRRAAAFLEIDPSTIYRKRQLWEGRAG